MIVIQRGEPVAPNHPPAGSLRERFARAAEELGIRGLPADVATNHDHYAHGTPKGVDRR